MDATGARTVWLVESGCAVLQSRLRGGRRQVLVVLLPGDAFDAAWAASIPGLELVATTASQLLRAQLPAAPDNAPDSNWRTEAVRGELARQVLGSLMLHAICLGRPTGEERIAAFLLSLERRRSEGGAAAASTAIALSRRDLADCLGLNPDTVSRILSALRRRKVLAQPSRNEILIKDGDALGRLGAADAG